MEGKGKGKGEGRGERKKMKRVERKRREKSKWKMPTMHTKGIKWDEKVSYCSIKVRNCSDTQVHVHVTNNYGGKNSVYTVVHHQNQFKVCPLTKMLRNLQHKAGSSVLHLQGIQNRRKFIFKLHINHSPNHCNHLALDARLGRGRRWGCFCLLLSIKSSLGCFVC